jgi:hypothetical protein
MTLKSDIWKEGKYIDLWTIPHVLSGVVFAGFLDYFGFNFLGNFLIYSFFNIGWEFFELYAFNVHEHIPNKIMDVVTGWIGFFVMYLLIIKIDIALIIPYLYALTALFIILNALGFYAYLKRKKNLNEKDVIFY